MSSRKIADSTVQKPSITNLDAVTVVNTAESSSLDSPALSSTRTDAVKFSSKESINLADVLTCDKYVKSEAEMYVTEDTTTNDKAANCSAQAGLLIRPHRSPMHSRAYTTNASPASVVVTLAVIESLRGLPLPQAARSIGVSATSFKRACRQLGVRRWQYTRGRGRPAGGPLQQARTPQAASDAQPRPDPSRLPESTVTTPFPDARWPWRGLSASPGSSASARIAGGAAECAEGADAPQDSAAACLGEEDDPWTDAVEDGLLALPLL